MSDDRIRQLVEKAHESIRAADGLFRDNHPDFSASRAYYAMFYLAEALLLTRDLKFKKHSGVIGAFNREFVKTKIFPDETFYQLQKAYDYRTQGDYSLVPMTAAESASVIEDAKQFVEKIESFLKKEGFLNY
ncbi:MAG: HEPN domain-containing protein [bacterium]